MVENAHVPRPIDQSAVNCFNHASRRIEDQQTASLSRCRGAIGGGQTADNHPASAQCNQSCCQADATCASAGKMGSINLSELADGAAGGYLHNCCSGSLQVRRGVEVADEDVSFHQISNRVRNDVNPIWVYIAVFGDGGSDNCNGV